MPSKKTRYTRLETDTESPDSDDEAPPAQVQLHASQYVRGELEMFVENGFASLCWNAKDVMVCVILQLFGFEANFACSVVVCNRSRC